MGDSKGRYSKYGWGQFLLMKEYVPNKPGNDVYTKEYDDVWYTMCFPFDLKLMWRPLATLCSIIRPTS